MLCGCANSRRFAIGRGWSARIPPCNLLRTSVLHQMRRFMAALPVLNSISKIGFIEVAYELFVRPQWRIGAFGGDVEASNTPTTRRFILSRRHRVSGIILVSARILDRGGVLFFYFAGGSNLAKMPVHELLCVRHAVIFQQLHVLFHPPVQRHAHLPGPGIDLRIVDSHFIEERIRAGGRVALGEVQRVAMMVPCPVKPRILDHPGYVDHQRIPVELSGEPLDQPIQESTGALLFDPIFTTRDAKANS